ncbi:flagellar hook-length control protein FliK [Phyllobacterium sp. TAF24]|uniref:flagellar hook-length control protein FliK n=1 Tax=Phyllobacterium sp. TAF24 TaxID=3233068 RepID=UPI003F9E941F
MTIGPDMPLRSLQDAIIGDTGKGHRLPDKKNAKGKDDAPDFKSMLEAKPLRLPTEAGAAITDDDVSEIRDEPETKKDKDKERANAGPSVQALFGQSILALEQLLDRQKPADGEQAPHQAKSVRVLDFDPKLIEDSSAEPAAAAGDEIVPALPKADRKVSIQSGEKPDAKGAVSAEAKAEPVRSDAPPPQETETQSVDAITPKARTSAKQVPEQAAPTVTNNTPSPASPMPSAEPRTSAATPVAAAPASQNRQPIADVQIISDHSTGAARTLVIQLQPIELGTVTARLRLTGEGMHIQLMAESKAAAEHLARDHEALGKALQRAGVADDTSTVTISVVDRSSLVANTQSSQQSTTGQDQQMGGRAGGQANSGSQGTQGDRSSGQQHFGDSRADERDDRAAKTVPDNTLSRGLVV